MKRLPCTRNLINVAIAERREVLVISAQLHRQQKSTAAVSCRHRPRRHHRRRALESIEDTCS